MHVHFEQNISTRTECTIHSLSWMGKVPDSLPEEAGAWKLNRTQYYMEGWLASGNAKGVVGVTFTTSHCKKYDAPSRSNFNLRGHRSEVILVSWNEPYQKLATCDSQGIIFVWIKHEGRWSIELINDRNSQVTDFAWSHDGRMALICYCDGFVLVGSVAGQRYWSSMLNLDNSTIACGVWTPDDLKVMFGTSDGQIIVMSSTGAMLTQVFIQEGMEITSMAWSCEKFNMDETQTVKENNEKISAFSPEQSEEKLSPRSHTLAVCFKYGAIYLMSNYDDLCPKIIHTLLTGLKIDWSNCGECLAVGGFTRLPNLQCRNELHFYSKDGQLRHWVSLPSQGKPLTALTWGHNDRRLFVSAGFNLFVAWVNKQVAPLQFICQRVIQMGIETENNIEKLPLPFKLRNGVKALYSPTIKSYIPDPFKLREFVSCPPPGNERLYCTMMRHGDETSGGHYTLYLEYLGGLIPLLKGKRASKLRPDFVIFDPKIRTKSGKGGQVKAANGELTETPDHSDIEQCSHSGSDSDVSTDGCGSPRLQRKRRQKFFRPDKVERSITFRTLDELLYNDSLPESNKLVEVISNIWGTKFRIQGIANYLPEDLGNVLYKTSLLHLQPRQMTITVTEICPGQQGLSRDPNFTPAGPSEAESEASMTNGTDENLDETISLITESGESFIRLSSQTAAEIVPTCVSPPQHDKSSTPDVDSTSTMQQMLTSLERQHKSPNMKKRSLSPATDSLAQNNHAFNVEPHPLVTDSTCLKPSPRTRIHTHMQLNIENAQNDVATASLANHVDSSYNYAIVNKTDSNELIATHNECVKRLSSEIESIIRSEQDSASRWADPASQTIKYIDEDIETDELPFENNIVCQMVSTPTMEVQKRLYLAPQLSQDGEEREDDVSPGDDRRNSIGSSSSAEADNSYSLDLDKLDYASSPVFLQTTVDTINSLTDALTNSFHKNEIPEVERIHSTSLPASPIKRNSKLDSPTKILQQEVLKGKCKHYSPIFTRKSKYCPKYVDSSDEDITTVEEMRLNHSYKNLESFQKAQLKQKLRRARTKSEDRGRQKAYGLRQFMVHNKAPLWNENSQVYQLDFGGRVTQESAKNFQIEFRGKQVMQFGRIDSNAYTLDFQYPFTALQAFAVALANVTQRLK